MILLFNFYHNQERHSRFNENYCVISANACDMRDEVCKKSFQVYLFVYLKTSVWATKDKEKKYDKTF